MPALDFPNYGREQPVEFERAHRPDDLLASRVEHPVHSGLRRIAVDSGMPFLERIAENPEVFLEQGGFELRRPPGLRRNQPSYRDCNYWRATPDIAPQCNFASDRWSPRAP